MFDSLMQQVQALATDLQPILMLPVWWQSALLAFSLMCFAMLCRRYAVFRIVAASALLAMGAVLLDLIPWPASDILAGQGIVLVPRQIIEIALLSVGGIWVFDEFRSMLRRDHKQTTVPARNVAAGSA